MGQSSNDTFPTAMDIAAVLEVQNRLLPRVRSLQQAIATKALRWKDVVKIGRTHLEDAVPLTVGQEWSGWAGQLDTRPLAWTTPCTRSIGWRPVGQLWAPV